MDLTRLSLRLRVFLFFAALAAANLAVLVAGIAWVVHAGAAPEVTAQLSSGSVLAAGVLGGLIFGVWFLFDRNVARPIERLAGAIRARTHAQVEAEFDQAAGRYLGDLAPAAAAVTQHLAETRSALTEAVQRETTRLAQEKERLEALLSDVPVGVLLCTADHQLVFYNGQAVDLLGGAHAPGLDRRVFDYLHRAPVVHAYERLVETDDADAASDLLCTTTADGKVLAARMRLISEGEGHQVRRHAGYVLTLRDVSGDIRAHVSREQLMDELFDRIRRPAAALQSLTSVLTADDGPTGAARDRVREAARAEAASLAQAIHTLFERHEAMRADWWPLAMVRASDLGEAVRARVATAGGGEVMVASAPLLLRCEGFEMVALIAALFLRLAAEGRRDFRLEIGEEGTGALIALEWDGAALPVGTLEHWLDTPLETGMDDVTGRRVIATHASEIWPEPLGPARGRICIPLREARLAAKRPRPVPRAVVYDFDLLGQVRNPELAATPLDKLTYVVFDTETTGLLPSEDEIVQIAAVRIVNGRRLGTEVFDTLVNPGRRIPPGSTEVHGITDAMVAEAPRIVEVGRRFHKFTEGAVLVAHNAPFDMEFLRRKEWVIGSCFDNPVLDTVLLSAVIFGESEVHSLDALTHRLGITIPEEARHTAIGDTIATADAFLKLLPSLKARGLNTFGEVVAEVRKYGRLMKDLNG